MEGLLGEATSWLAFLGLIQPSLRASHSFLGKMPMPMGFVAGFLGLTICDSPVSVL